MRVKFVTVSDAKQRALRTLIQFIVSGGLMLFLKSFVVSMDPQTQLVVVGLLQLFVTFVHNWAEDHGYLPPVGKDAVGQ